MTTDNGGISSSHVWMSGERLVTDAGTFLPVRITSLVVDAVTRFDLYTRPNEDAPPVLYRERKLPFTAADRQRLQDSGIIDLFVSESDETNFRQYIESNLGDILRDSARDSAEKASLAYYSSQGLVADVFNDPRSTECIERSKTLVLNMAEYMLQDESSLSNLMKVMSFDYYTYTHSVNVFVFCLSLAQQCGIDNIEALRELGEGALLHDIGKSRLDPALVSYQGDFSKEQFEEMKLHTVYGYELLEEQGCFTPITLSIVRSHHERLNGDGYPDGLKGGEINPFVRICAIAEIFDSMTTKRPYKEASKSFNALEVMRDEIRGDLDPKFFKAFVEMLGAG